jgi:hypothetical protein
MANTLINSTLLSKQSAAYFKTNNTFIATANRQYDGIFRDNTYDAGQTINIRLDNQHKVQRGNSVTASDIKETYLPLTLRDLYTVYINYSTIDLSTTLRYNSWKDRVLLPAVRNIISDINKDIALDAVNSAYLSNGTPGTPINTFAAVDNTGAIMVGQGIDKGKEWFLSLNPYDASALKSALQNSFNTTLNEEISFGSQLGKLSHFTVFEDQSIAAHQSYTGTYGTPVVNGAVSSGNTIVAAGFDDGGGAGVTGMLKKGDIIEITHATLQPYFVNRVNKINSRQKAQFLVTADVNVAIGGAATIPVNPTINIDTDDPNQNLSGAIPDGATITVIRNSTDGLQNVNIAYPSCGLYAVCPPLEKLDACDSSTFMDPETGWSVRISKGSSIGNNVNQLRLDVLCGWVWIPSQIVRLVS